ncbi:hypothetical protein [Halorubrum vacuolatum]|uniref:DUF8215 domain-containing protein n=1 Tax=Halorubrum vacuolatum TaxID=63740 RepID=A0A238VT62_HALVU|nr:hypothetical protein [Halorubrum vacuolatum]SNR37505.1 hypothetical protein SAMN06264855_10447 [Halorubrum vacuolatum]
MSKEPRGYDEKHYSQQKEGVGLWVERYFYAGIEITALSTPAFVPVVLFQHLYPDAIPLAGLAALIVGSFSLAVLRAQAIDLGPWPRLGELSSVPLRATYFSATFLAATFGVAAVAAAIGSLLVAFFGGIIVPTIAYAAFPRVYRAIHGATTRHPSQRP